MLLSLEGISKAGCELFSMERVVTSWDGYESVGYVRLLPSAMNCDQMAEPVHWDCEERLVTQTFSNSEYWYLSRESCTQSQESGRRAVWCGVAGQFDVMGATLAARSDRP